MKWRRICLPAAPTRPAGSLTKCSIRCKVPEKPSVSTLRFGKSSRCRRLKITSTSQRLSGFSWRLCSRHAKRKSCVGNTRRFNKSKRPVVSGISWFEAAGFTSFSKTRGLAFGAGKSLRKRKSSKKRGRTQLQRSMVFQEERNWTLHRSTRLCAVMVMKQMRKRLVGLTRSSFRLAVRMKERRWLTRSTLSSTPCRISMIRHRSRSPLLSITRNVGIREKSLFRVTVSSKLDAVTYVVSSVERRDTASRNARNGRWKFGMKCPRS